jgi:hypothetical protein
MSKKGSYIYQQIEQTTAEWATSTDIYPASIWLFERLENGKFNMKLSDGVNTFANLPAIFQDADITVKTNTDTEYVLTITIGALSFDTPNLKGKSAYQSWLDTGNSGTEAEFVNSYLSSSLLVAISSTATNEQIPNAKSVWDLVQDILATIPPGGLKVPISHDLESTLPDPTTLEPGDIFYVQDMDVTAEGKSGQVWVNYTDPDDTNTALMYYKVVDQYQTMDGESITQTGSGAWEVNTTWLASQLTSLLASYVPASRTIAGLDLTANRSAADLKAALGLTNDFTNTYKAKLDRIGAVASVATLTDTPVTSEIVKISTGANQTLTLAATMNAGELLHILITATADITVALPTTGAWINAYGASLSLASGDTKEISVLFDGTNNILRVVE